jgi:hypothetical protein
MTKTQQTRIEFTEANRKLRLARGHAYKQGAKAQRRRLERIGLLALTAMADEAQSAGLYSRNITLLEVERMIAVNIWWSTRREGEDSLHQFLAALGIDWDHFCNRSNVRTRRRIVREAKAKRPGAWGKKEFTVAESYADLIDQNQIKLARQSGLRNCYGDLV